MHPATSSEQLRRDSQRFVLEMIGFSGAEKTMLSSTFRLTGRRSFSYTEPTTPGQRADIYLINTDVPESIDLLRQRVPNLHAPAVLIGRERLDSAWPLIEKPIHWIRLFDQLDEQMANALQRRANRNSSVTTPWDGRTWRRASDRDRVTQPELADRHPVESVLVVDDSATVRAFMRAKLAPFHFDVDFAESGEKAIDMAQSKSYTCIFLDILMAGMDGYQVCKRIKSSPATREAAVVMLSSKSSAFDKFRGNWAGCDAYLGKPVGEDELLATIARFLPSARSAAAAIKAGAA